MASSNEDLISATPPPPRTNGYVDGGNGARNGGMDDTNVEVDAEIAFLRDENTNAVGHAKVVPSAPPPAVARIGKEERDSRPGLGVYEDTLPPIDSTKVAENSLDPHLRTSGKNERLYSSDNIHEKSISLQEDHLEQIILPKNGSRVELRLSVENKKEVEIQAFAYFLKGKEGGLEQKGFEKQFYEEGLTPEEFEEAVMPYETNVSKVGAKQKYALELAWEAGTGGKFAILISNNLKNKKKQTSYRPKKSPLAEFQTKANDYPQIKYSLRAIPKPEKSGKPDDPINSAGLARNSTSSREIPPSQNQASSSASNVLEKGASFRSTRTVQNASTEHSGGATKIPVNNAAAIERTQVDSVDVLVTKQHESLVSENPDVNLKSKDTNVVVQENSAGSVQEMNLDINGTDTVKVHTATSETAGDARIGAQEQNGVSVQSPPHAATTSAPQDSQPAMTSDLQPVPNSQSVPNSAIQSASNQKQRSVSFQLPPEEVPTRNIQAPPPLITSDSSIVSAPALQSGSNENESRGKDEEENIPEGVLSQMATYLGGFFLWWNVDDDPTNQADPAAEPATGANTITTPLVAAEVQPAAVAGVAASPLAAQTASDAPSAPPLAAQTAADAPSAPPPALPTTSNVPSAPPANVSAGPGAVPENNASGTEMNQGLPAAVQEDNWGTNLGNSGAGLLSAYNHDIAADSGSQAILNDVPPEDYAEEVVENGQPYYPYAALDLSSLFFWK